MEDLAHTVGIVSRTIQGGGNRVATAKVMIEFDKGRSREIRTVMAGEDGDWELSSRPRLADEPLTLHAVARLATAGDRQAAPLFTERKSARGEVDAETLYRLAAQLGLNYGSQFRTVTRIVLLGRDEAVAHLDSSVIAEPLERYLMHPALVDGALQGLLALIADHHADLEGASFLPWRFGRVRIAAPFGRPACCARLRVTRLGTRSASADIALFDAAGEIVGELSDCWFRRVELTRAGQIVNNSTFQPFLVFLFVGAIYFAICYPLSVASRVLERRLHVAR